MIRTFMAWTSVVVMAVAFLVYVGSAVLYLAPPNPLSLQSLPAIRAILHPFFSQNWHLFAPNPIRSNFVLTVRCRVNGQTSPWHDPFTPLQAQHHRHRFSPMGKVTRVPFNSMLIFLRRSPDEWRPLLCRHVRDHPVCRGEDPASKKQRERGLFLLQRISSAACDELVGPRRSSHVQARILIHEPPPWSQRHMPGTAGSTKYLALPWMVYMPWLGLMADGKQ